MWVVVDPSFKMAFEAHDIILQSDVAFAIEWVVAIRRKGNVSAITRRDRSPVHAGVCMSTGFYSASSPGSYGTTTHSDTLYGLRADHAVLASHPFNAERQAGDDKNTIF